MGNSTFSNTVVRHAVTPWWASQQTYTLCAPSISDVSLSHEEQGIFCVLFRGTTVTGKLGWNQKNRKPTVQVVFHHHGPWAALVPLYRFSAWGFSPLCPSMWWALSMVSSDGPHDLCEMAAGTCFVVMIGSGRWESPDVHAEFLKGNFACERSTHTFSLIGKDQSHEQSNKSIQAHGGAVWLYENPEGLTLHAGPNCSWFGEPSQSPAHCCRGLFRIAITGSRRRTS